MPVGVRYSDDVVILDIAGEVIGEARSEIAEILNREIEKPENKGVIINVEESPMTDSVFFGVLVAASIRLEKTSRKLVLLNPGKSWRCLLTITSFDDFFKKFDDEDEAMTFVKVPTMQEIWAKVRELVIFVGPFGDQDDPTIKEALLREDSGQESLEKSVSSIVPLAELFKMFIKLLD